MMTVYWPNGMRMHSIDNWMFDCLTGKELLQRHYGYNETNRWSFLVFPGRIKFTIGNSMDVKHLLLNSDIHMDISRIKKHWYWMYCEAHGYIIMENYMTQLRSTQIAINSSKSEMMIYKAERTIHDVV